jgi:threonine/homoserine/homoserine lactone efflux protein
VSRLAEFALMAFIVELTPGPNMAYLAALSIAHGRRAGFAAVLGVATGLLVYGSLTAVGLSSLIESIPGAYQALRWCGLLYMIWLAVSAWRGEDLKPGAEPRAAPGDTTLLWRGFVINMLNPKAAIFYLAVLPQFVDPGSSALLTATFALVAIYVAVATAVHLSIVAAAAALSPLFTSGGSREKTLRRGLAIALALIALWMFFSTRR